jgi:serine phosphatase RsbU (regulator of sigma subunit)
MIVLQCFRANAGTAIKDSLWNVWNDNKQHDTLRLQAIKSFIWSNILFSAPDSALKLADLQYSFAQQKNLKSYQADAFRTKGIAENMLGDYSKSLENFQQSLDSYKQANNKKGIAESSMSLGLAYFYFGDYVRSIQLLTESLKLNEEINDKHGMAKSLSNIGIVTGEQNDFEESLENFNKSLLIFNELNDLNSKASILNNIGSVYLKMQQFYKAIEAYSEAREINEKIGNINGLSNSIVNLGSAYASKGDLEKGLAYFIESLELSKSVGNKSGEAKSNSLIGNLYVDSKLYDKAIKYLQSSLAIAKEIGDFAIIKESAKYLYKAYKAKGNDKLSLQYHELFIQMRDSVEKDENRKELLQQRFQYDFDKKEALLAKEQERKDAISALQIKQKNQQRNVLIVGLLLLFIFSIFIYNRFRITRKQKAIIELQRKEVEAQKNIAESRKEIVEQKNTEILASITYAKRIQSAIMPPESVVNTLLNDSFILYLPKDIVAGDFYWVQQLENNIYFAACDCTGHGVPGALVSVVCNNALNSSLLEHKSRLPHEIFNKARTLVIENFELSDQVVQDGMDASLCVLDIENNELMWAGANNPLWIFRLDEKIIEEFKPDKMFIGQSDNLESFHTKKTQLNKGDVIYIFTDGYVDQFGGEKGKKLMKSNFKKLILDIAMMEMKAQKQQLQDFFIQYKGNEEQVDDICVIGVRV